MKTLQEKIDALAEELFTDWAKEIDIEMGMDHYDDEGHYHQGWLSVEPSLRKHFVDTATGYARHFGLWVPEGE